MLLFVRDSNNVLSIFFLGIQVFNVDDEYHSNDKEQVKHYFNVIREVDKHLITHRPPNKGFEANWGEKEIDELGDAILSGDLRTDKHKLLVATKFGFGIQWKEKVGTYNKNTPFTEKNYDWVYLNAKYGKSTVKMGMVEGMQRSAAVIQAFLGRPIDDNTSRVSDSKLFKWAHFVESQLIDKVRPGSVGTDGIILHQDVQKYFEHVLNPKNDCPRLTNPLTVSIAYIKVKDEKVTKILHATRCVSESISDNKRTSSKRDAMTKIAVFGKVLIEGIPQVNLHNRPNIAGSKVRISLNPYVTKAKASELLTKSSNNEDTAWRAGAETQIVENNLVNSEVFKEYCTNPFDVQSKIALERLLTFESVEDPKINVTLPFWHTIDTMAKDRTSETVPDSWTLNALLLYPRVFMYLYADLHHVTVEEVKNDPRANGLCLFGAKYQLLTTGIVSTQIHGAMNTSLYPNCTYTNYANQEPNTVVGAAVMIVDMLNAALLHPSELQSKSYTMAEQDKLEAIQKQRAVDFYNTLAPIHDQGNHQIDKVLFNLGKLHPWWALYTQCSCITHTQIIHFVIFLLFISFSSHLCVGVCRCSQEIGNKEQGGGG